MTSDMKTVLITGAAERIGAHIAKGLAAQGWTIAVHYNRSKDKADNLVSEIIKAGGKAVSVQANLCVPEDVDSLVARASEALGGGLNALINNASTFHPDDSEDFTRALYDHHMDVNLHAPLKLAQSFSTQDNMNFGTQERSGCIINIIDQRVLKPNPLYFTYSLSKAGLYWATKTLAQSLAPNIRVNGIGPGPTLKNTEQSDEEFASEAALTLLENGSPPSAIFHSVQYLLQAHAVTGQMIAVDGGQHLNWDTADLTLGLYDNAPSDHDYINEEE